jgi:hypothetical protein
MQMTDGEIMHGWECHCNAGFMLEMEYVFDKHLIVRLSQMSHMTAMNESQPTPARVLPDPAICRVRPIGSISAFGQCQVDRPVECRYVLYFGEGNICRHPRWKEFIAAEPQPAPDARRESRPKIS